MRDKYGTGGDVVYCYPGTDILKNILDIRDQDLLNKAEVEFSQYRIATYNYPILNDFSLSTWKNIHFYLFQDVYSWAGEVRTVKISKGNTMFAMPEFVESEAKKLFNNLRKESFLAGQEQNVFVERLAYYFGELNMLHPFREGNGRSQRLLFEMIAVNAGYALNWSAVNKEDWIPANIAAVNCDSTPLAKLFGSVVVKIVI